MEGEQALVWFAVGPSAGKIHAPASTRTFEILFVLVQERVSYVDRYLLTPRKEIEPTGSRGLTEARNSRKQAGRVQGQRDRNFTL